MKKVSIISFVFAVLIIAATAYIGSSGKVALFIDFPSVVITLFLSVVILISHFSFRELISAFKNSSLKRRCSKTEIDLSILVFDAFQKYLIFSAFIALLIGLVCIFSNLKNTEEMGKGLGVCILSALYCVVFIFQFILPFKYALCKKRILNANETEK